MAVTYEDMDTTSVYHNFVCFGVIYQVSWPGLVKMVPLLRLKFDGVVFDCIVINFFGDVYEISNQVTQSALGNTKPDLFLTARPCIFHQKRLS